MEEVIAQFRLAGPAREILPFGGGHINDTFRIRTAAGTPDYLLQRINHHVFRDVAALTANIRLVTGHLHRRMAEAPAAEQVTLTIVPTRGEADYCRDAYGDYWRVFEFLDGLHAYDRVATPRQAYEGARSFGYFLRFLDDLPAERLTATIPGFHDLALRLRQFRTAAAAPAGDRGAATVPERAQVHALADRLLLIDQLAKDGGLRARVTHNDTKFNNVLLTPADRGRCVVDLDTVMPGVVAFDFGDGVRTGAATAAEDAADLPSVGVDLEHFRAFTAGYLSVTRDVLTPTELELLGLSGAYMAFIMGVRFLTDYLAGDTYYKVRYPEQNLVRARNQLRLAEEFTARRADLDAIVAGA